MHTALPLHQSLRLDGRVALITGAATGIGRATALAFAQAGAAVAVNHLDTAAQAEAAGTLLHQIRAAGGQALALAADVRVGAAVRELVTAAEAAFGPLDILVNNAGVIQERPFLETDEADWDRIVDTDLKSVFLCCRAVLGGMAARQRGVVVNIASDLGILGRAQYVPYCAAKAGVIGLTRALAREFAPAVRVNAIAPGPIATAMLTTEHMSPETLELELAIPQHRFGAPEDIAATALFLASDLSAFYCGQVLGPNGGSVMP